MGDLGACCSQNYLGLGQELPEVVGETAWYDRYAPGGRNERFRGSVDKVRDVASSWRHAKKLMLNFLEDSQTYASTANKSHCGEAADAFDRYLRNCVGFGTPPEQAQQDEPLVANLVAACSQLAKACERYADHIEAALEKIVHHDLDIFEFDAPGTIRCSGAAATTAACSTLS
ncbi:WXG100-like domain-containing protein [Streptomyces sp. NPDC002851]